jgi:tripartite-type tricarboxylate transporter receptor subunit TctC
MNVTLFKKMPYDPVRDLQPLTLVGTTPPLVLAHPSLPAKSVKELVALARAKPGALSYASIGTGSPQHFAGELMKSTFRIDIVHVPYKGAGPALAGLLGGEVGMTVSAVSSALPHIESGKAKALAVLSSKRARSLPDVPSAREAGVPNWEVGLWWGILAPAGTPREIVDRLHREWVKAAALPDTIEKMRKAGYEPLTSTPDEFSQFVRSETDRWAKVIKDSNISTTE